MPVQQILSAYLVPGTVVLVSQRPNRHIPDLMELLTDLTGRRISFIHSVTFFGTYFVPNSVLVPRNIAVKETDKIPSLRELVLLFKGEIYVANKKKKF